MTVRVMIVDDQPMIRAGFRALLEPAEDIEVVADVGDGATAVQQVRELRPDVVLMDIRMPGMDGLAATRAICADPGLVGVRVVILTTFERDEYVFESLRAGASGFLSKSVDPDDLRKAIYSVVAGESLLSPAATKSLIGAFLAAPPPAGAIDPHPGLAHLTDREIEVVQQVATGLTNSEIAKRFAISPLTVKTHVSRAMVKLGLRDRSQLVVVAYQEGLADVHQRFGDSSRGATG